MSKLITRAVTGTVFIGLILGSLWFHPLTAAVVFGIFMIIGIQEYHTFFAKSERVETAAIGSMIMASLSFTIFVLYLHDVLPFGMLALILPVVFGTFISELWRKKKDPVMNMATQAFMFIYIVIPFSILAYLAVHFMNGISIVIGLFLLVWTNDTFAFLTGKLLGKNKMFPRISPNKTWEGTIGGFAFAVIVGATIGWFTSRLDFWVVTACIVAPSAVLGDLLESMMKRHFEVKDSGTLLPGHGGVLDRFDATLFAAPFFLAWDAIYLAYIY